MSAVPMTVVGESGRSSGAVKRNALLVAAIMLAVFWIAPLLILVMNALKTPN